MNWIALLTNVFPEIFTHQNKYNVAECYIEAGGSSSGSYFFSVLLNIAHIHNSICKARGKASLVATGSPTIPSLKLTLLSTMYLKHYNLIMTRSK